MQAPIVVFKHEKSNGDGGYSAEAFPTETACTLLFSHGKVQEIMSGKCVEHKASILRNAAVIGLQRHMGSAVQRHVHGYAILELLPRRNHAQSLYCGGENE